MSRESGAENTLRDTRFGGRVGAAVWGLAARFQASAVCAVTLLEKIVALSFQYIASRGRWEMRVGGLHWKWLVNSSPEGYGRASASSATRLSRRRAMPISSFESAAVATSQTGAERWDKRQRFIKNSTPRRRGETRKNWSGDSISASSGRTKRSTRLSMSFRRTSPGSTARVDRLRISYSWGRPAPAKPGSSKPRRKPCSATRVRSSRLTAVSSNIAMRSQS